MGCACSKTDDTDTSDQQFLTPEEIKIVKELWVVLWSDHEAIGLDFFTRLLDMKEDFTKFFKTAMTEDESGRTVFDLHDLRNHADILMKALNATIDILEDQSLVSDRLYVTGGEHVKRHVDMDLIYFFWPALRNVAKDRMGEEFTRDMELAWKHFFDFVISQMKAGYEAKRLLTNRKEGKRHTFVRQLLDNTSPIFRHLSR